MDILQPTSLSAGANPGGRAVLEHHGDAFESDLRGQLLACGPDGVFEQDLTFAYELARRAA